MEINKYFHEIRGTTLDISAPDQPWQGLSHEEQTLGHARQMISVARAAEVKQNVQEQPDNIEEKAGKGLFGFGLFKRQTHEEVSPEKQEILTHRQKGK